MLPQPRYKKGDKIGGRYLVHQALMGGMGEVYLCLDLKQNYPFALKTFQFSYLMNQKFREAFKREVATWVALEKHPNIVRCFYMDIIDNQPFMFLEWVTNNESRGTDLRSWLRWGPLDLRLALDFIIDICRGLIHADKRQPGIVHRDLKPDNILIAEGRIAKITDFGLAKIVQDAKLEIPEAQNELGGLQRLSNAGGTPTYMAPEQWRGEELDVRTDIYAIGCILYEVLTGRWPFSATTLENLRRQHLEAAIPTLAVNIARSSALDSLIARCLAKQKDKRFATIGNLLDELSQIYRQLFLTSHRIIELDANFTAKDYINRGLTYTSLQHYKEALVDLTSAIKLDPTNPQAYNNRGHAYTKMQCYSEALADFNHAINLDSTLALAYNNRGFVFYLQSRFNEALADYNRAIELDSTLARAYENRGAIYGNLRKYNEALIDYNRAIELDPNFARAFYNRGLTYANMQYNEKALADFTRTIQLDPDFTRTYYDRGITYHRLERYEDALKDFTCAIQLDPNNSYAYNNRGYTYAALGRYDEEIADYKRAIELDPTNVNAYMNLGVSLCDHGKLREALVCYEKAAKLGSAQGAQYAEDVRQMLKMQKEGDSASNKDYSILQG